MMATYLYFLLKVLDLLDTVKLMFRFQNKSHIFIVYRPIQNCLHAGALLSQVANIPFPFDSQIFFIMRKKFSHVTFLHVYHHTGMVLGGYIASRFSPAGHGTMLGVLNCFVHSVMYGYYLFSVVDENVKKSIWWKKHITQIQLMQFLLLAVHFSVGIFVIDCTYPKFFCIIMAIQNLFMMCMFGDFYRRAYLTKKIQ